jgi:nicotinamidase-related amidase
MKALLIIDMQNAGFPEGLFRYDADGVIQRINQLATAMRKAGNKVLFIQHDGTKENAYIPGTGDWVIIPSLHQKEGDIYIGKTANDAFYKSALETTLDDLGIKELIITGWATDYCVDTTVRSALARDYYITVASDAHTCGNRPHLDADKIIPHHNYIWANMTPTNGTIQVVDTGTIIEQLCSSSLVLCYW